MTPHPASPPIIWETLSRDALDLQLSPSNFAKDIQEVLHRHEEITVTLKDDRNLHVCRDITYGAAAQERFDLVTPQGQGPFPCLVFIHGGFWMEGSRTGSGFAAQTLALNGWANALIGYSLAPGATLAEIVAEISAALEYLADHAIELNIDPDYIVIAGHSAGAYLAAAMITGLGSQKAAQVAAGALLISGVYDIAPLTGSYIGEVVDFGPPPWITLSPIYHQPLRDIPIHILVGADEPDHFMRHSRMLHEYWGPARDGMELHVAPCRDHFDVLDELSDAGSASFKALMAMAG
ncbi:MAG: alpha/beta hydrolase [Pseudorhodobacter sp.]